MEKNLEKVVSDRVLGHPKRWGGGGLTGMTQRDYLDHRLVECIAILDIKLRGKKIYNIPILRFYCTVRRQRHHTVQ